MALSDPLKAARDHRNHQTARSSERASCPYNKPKGSADMEFLIYINQHTKGWLMSIRNVNQHTKGAHARVASV